MDVCQQSLRLLEQLNHDRQNKSRVSKVLIFHITYLCGMEEKRDDFPHLASFMFLLLLLYILSEMSLQAVNGGGHAAHLFGIPSKPTVMFWGFFCLSAALE